MSSISKAINEQPILLANYYFSEQLILRAALETQGYAHVLSTHNGESAWRKILAATPSLVVCDLDLALLSGCELMEMCWNALGEMRMPFILLLPEQDAGSRHATIAYGDCYTLAKPYTIAQFLTTVHRALYGLKNVPGRTQDVFTVPSRD